MRSHITDLGLATLSALHGRFDGVTVSELLEDSGVHAAVEARGLRHGRSAVHRCLHSLWLLGRVRSVSCRGPRPGPPSFDRWFECSKGLLLEGHSWEFDRWASTCPDSPGEGRPTDRWPDVPAAKARLRQYGDALHYWQQSSTYRIFGPNSRLSSYVGDCSVLQQVLPPELLRLPDAERIMAEYRDRPESAVGKKG